MADRRQAEQRGVGRFLLGMAIINVLPISALFWVGYALWSGQKTVDDLRSYFPEGSGANTLNLCGAMAVMFLSGTLIVPVSHGWAKRLKAQLNPSAGASFLDVLLWLPRKVSLMACVVVRSIGFLLGLLSILFVLLFVGRMLSPDLLVDVIRVEAWATWVAERL